jgi:CubicO group peptidase (beta-lactamase class C family)
MLMTPRQMLAFGELYLNGGVVNGRRVVSQAWIDRSFIPRGRSHYSDQQYGYGWWIRELGGYQTYYAWGYGGQFIFIVPDLDLVVVATSSESVGARRRGHRRTLYEIVEQLVIEPVAGAAAN